VIFIFKFILFAGLFLDRLVGTVSLFLETDVNARQTGITMHQAKVIVGLIVAAADGDKMIRTSGQASASSLAIGTHLTLSSSPAYHHTAFIYSSSRSHQ
jgi:hypothetical protein